MTETSSQPKIAILLAVYNPDPRWFREQLQSLNRQSYPNLHLFVRDDCSPKVPFEEICDTVRECITAFPYTINRNEHNMGSNLTFEQLTREAEGDRFAYCDQDDVWLPEKLEVMSADMDRTGALLCCSDVAVINGDSVQIAPTIRKVRKHCKMRSGDDLADYVLFRNFVFGCASLVDGPSAKAAVPFCPFYFHDHYLTLWCAEHGGIYAEKRALIQYRLHGNNQTGVMLGVCDKESYAGARIQVVEERMDWLEEHFHCRPKTLRTIQDGRVWSRARLDYWLRGKNLGTMWRYRYLSVPMTVFEVVAAKMPNWMLMMTMKLLRSNLL